MAHRRVPAVQENNKNSKKVGKQESWKSKEAGLAKKLEKQGSWKSEEVSRSMTLVKCALTQTQDHILALLQPGGALT